MNNTSNHTHTISNIYTKILLFLSDGRQSYSSRYITVIEILFRLTNFDNLLRNQNKLITLPNMPGQHST